VENQACNSRGKKQYFEKLIGLKFTVEDQRATTLDAQDAISQSESQQKILMHEI
jgi:hypothetical protein